jgi:hypothetical protein
MISYVSELNIGQHFVKDEMSNIVDIAQRRNKREGVTGVLFYENNRFFQIIEGAEKNVCKIYSSIEIDNRHTGLVKLVDQTVNERTFEDWSMESFYVDNPELINPQNLMLLRELYIHNFGVNASGLVNFVRMMIDEMDTFKIVKGLKDH